MNDRMNTAFGWILASCGIALGGSIVADMYFKGDGADVGEDFAWGYVIDAPEETAGGAAEVVPMAVRLNTGSAEAGAAVYAKCSACHTIEQGGAAGIGPNLYGVMGATIGQHAPGYAYSDALASVDGVWDYDTMDAWLTNPAAFASGTKMTFAGLTSAEERANVILYMRSFGDEGMTIPDMPAEEPAAEEGAEEAPAEEAAAEEAAAE